MNKLIVFDIDGTLIGGNSWLSLNLAVGVTKEEDFALYTAYSNGKLAYADWTTELVRLYQERGILTESVAVEALTSYTLVPGARELVSELKGKGYMTAAITGGFDITAEAIRNDLGLTYAQAVSSISFTSEDMVETIISKGEESYAKVELLEALCNELGITLRDCICIGDGGNNIKLFDATGHGITFASSSDAVKQHAEHVVESLQHVGEVT